MSKTIANAPADKKQVAWKKFLISGTPLNYRCSCPSISWVEKREAIKPRAKECVFCKTKRSFF
jgi:hypothetical protein